MWWGVGRTKKSQKQELNLWCCLHTVVKYICQSHPLRLCSLCCCYRSSEVGHTPSGSCPAGKVPVRGGIAWGPPVLRGEVMWWVWLQQCLALPCPLKEESNKGQGRNEKRGTVGTVGCGFMALVTGLVFANIFLLFRIRCSSPILFSLRERSFMLSAWMLFPVFHVLSVS